MLLGPYPRLCNLSAISNSSCYTKPGSLCCINQHCWLQSCTTWIPWLSQKFRMTPVQLGEGPIGYRGKKKQSHCAVIKAREIWLVLLLSLLFCYKIHCSEHRLVFSNTVRGSHLPCLEFCPWRWYLRSTLYSIVQYDTNEAIIRIKSSELLFLF